MAWLTGWHYRKSVTLSRASGAVTNYQMRLLVGESSGASGEDVDCGGLCASDFDDIRFTTSDGTTLLDYWIESVSGTTPNQLATIWIEFDSIGTGATTFYMYYGNSGAAAASSGANTFIVFDDFERGVDGDTIGGAWTEVTAHVHISTDHAYDGTRCAKFVGNATAGPGATIPVTHGDICITFQLWHESAAQAIMFHHGNASKSTWFIANLSQVDWYDGSYHTISGYYTVDNWTLVELKNFNWSTFKYDGVVTTRSVSGANMAPFGGENILGIYNNAKGVDYDNYIDQLRVRKYYSTEPAWGSWGNQETIRKVSGIYVPNTFWLSRSLFKRREI